MERVQELYWHPFEQVENRWLRKRKWQQNSTSSADAALNRWFLKSSPEESDYMTLDEAGIGMSPADMGNFWWCRWRKTSLPLLFPERSGTGSFVKYHCLLNGLFVYWWGLCVVRKTYLDQGLGQILLEEESVNTRPVFFQETESWCPSAQWTGSSTV